MPEGGREPVRGLTWTEGDDVEGEEA
jgi:hypothetical protein